MEWRAGPSAAGGATVPGAGYGVQYSADYDPVGQRVLMAFSPGATYTTQMWAFRPGYNKVGKFSSFALPTSSGSTYGVNYAYFPFTVGGQCKQVNMCYCPLNDRLYASGGDIQPDGSNTEGIWSMDMATGEWRKDSGILGAGQTTLWAYPQPTGYQDGTGFWWMPSRAKLLFGMQCGESYLEVNDTRPNWVYARGVWTFDPALYPRQDAWEQSLALTEDVYGTIDYGAVHERPQTGCQFGGHYDPQTDTVWVFPDGAAGQPATMAKYNVATWTKSASPSFRFPLHPAGTASAYFRQQGPVAIGREIYTLGYLTDGVTIYWRLLRYHMDQQVLVKSYAGPVFTPRTWQLSGYKLETSNGKVVFFNKGFPEADVQNIFVFDPVAETWTEDTHRPTYATLLANSTHSLPDGRIAMCGALGQPAGTLSHLFFYEVV
jgi:hypothetical protein